MVSGHNQRDLLMQIFSERWKIFIAASQSWTIKKVPCRCKTKCQSPKSRFFDLGELLDRLADDKQTINQKSSSMHR